MFVVEYVSGFAQLSAYSPLVAFYISFKDPDGKDLMVIPQCELTPGNHLYTFGSVTKMYVAEDSEISMLYWFKDAVIEGTGANFIGYLDTMPKPVGSLISAVIHRAIPRVAWP